MEPSARPVINVDPIMVCPPINDVKGRGAAASHLVRSARSLDREDLAVDEPGEDVILGAKRVLIVRREGLLVGLDQPLMGVDVIIPLADRGTVQRACVLD